MNKQLPAWTLYLTIGISLFLICGVGAIASTAQPEPEVRTVTETKIEKVPGKTRTVEKEVKVEVEKLSTTCRNALVDSVQNMADYNALVGQIGDAIVEWSETLDTTQMTQSLAQQKIVISDMLKAVEKAVQCDPTIGQDVQLPE